MNYFEHFGIPVSFQIDPGELKRLYLLKSREYHPDFYTLHNNEIQEQMLQKSSYNNEAYNTLKDQTKRLKYILDLNEVIEGENDNPLHQVFLMEMMEINEELMELSLDHNVDKENAIRNQLENMEKSLLHDITPAMQRYDHSNPSEEDLRQIKEFYFKSKYLWRLRENLDKFASP